MILKFQTIRSISEFCSCQIFAVQGILPTRGSVVLDLVFLAMFAIPLVLLLSIALVRRGYFQAHRRIQIGLSAVLLIAVLVFEIDVRFITDWRSLASQSPFYESGVVGTALAIHLLFAIPTPFVWGYVLVQALKRYPQPPIPGPHSARHKVWGWIAVLLMLATAITGCTFYWLAFIA